MSTAAYQQLENRIRKGDLDALFARWEFGRKLLKERGTAKRLPNGRLEQLSRTLGRGSSPAELSNRMQFAAEYPTKDMVRAAFTIHDSWYAICARGLGDRRQFASDEGPVAEDELALAGVQHDLEAWKLLDRNALVAEAAAPDRQVLPLHRTARG